MKKREEHLYESNFRSYIALKQIKWVQDVHASRQSPTINKYASEKLLRIIPKPWLPFLQNNLDYLCAPTSEQKLAMNVAICPHAPL